MTEVTEFKAYPFKTRLLVVWGFFWRGILITIASMIAAGIIGGIIGLVAALFGIPLDVGITLARVVGGVLSFYFLWLYIHWLFRASLSGHRLHLVRQ